MYERRSERLQLKNRNEFTNELTNELSGRFTQKDLEVVVDLEKMLLSACHGDSTTVIPKAVKYTSSTRTTGTAANMLQKTTKSAI